MGRNKVISTLFILAGEPSGDVIGATFLRKLRDRREVVTSGVGGPEMQSAGLKSIFPMEDLSVMGFADVALRLPFLLWRIEQTVRRIISENSDVVLLIDSQVFSAMVAKKLRQRGFVKPIILYVAPAVWAWKPERAPKLKALYNEILAVLPFEPEAMQRLGGPPTSYVGHPATEQIIGMVERPTTRRVGKIALLPGSRRGEVRRHTPVCKEIAETLIAHKQVSGFFLPTLPHLVPHVREHIASWSVDVEVISDIQLRRKSLEKAAAAIATAGTITLELALASVPHVGTYVPDKWQMKAFQTAGEPMISLANNILGQALVPEIFPGENHADRVSKSVIALLEDEDALKKQLDGFEEIRRRMKTGESGVGKQDAVDRVLSYFPTG